MSTMNHWSPDNLHHIHCHLDLWNSHCTSQIWDTDFLILFSFRNWRAYEFWHDRHLATVVYLGTPVSIEYQSNFPCSNHYITVFEGYFTVMQYPSDAHISFIDQRHFRIFNDFPSSQQKKVMFRFVCECARARARQ